MSFFGDIISIGTGIIGLADGGDDSDAVEETFYRADEIVDFLLDPSSEGFQTIQGLYEEGLNRTTIESINELLTADKRQVARTGGLGYLNPERRDEYASGTIIREAAVNKEAAISDTGDYLLGVLGGVTGEGGLAGSAKALESSEAEEEAEFDDDLAAIGSLGGTVESLYDQFLDSKFGESSGGPTSSTFT